MRYSSFIPSLSPPPNLLGSYGGAAAGSHLQPFRPNARYPVFWTPKQQILFNYFVIVLQNYCFKITVQLFVVAVQLFRLFKKLKKSISKAADIQNRNHLPPLIPWYENIFFIVFTSFFGVLEWY